MGLQYRKHIFAKPAWLGNVLSDLPDSAAVLFVDGVPEEFPSHTYTADSELSIGEPVPGMRYLRFGSSGLSNAVSVDLASGHVLEVLGPPHYGHHATVFINSSLRLFDDTVRAVISRFPFHDAEAEWDEINAIADELLWMIREIDHDAAEPDRYWSTFVDDVSMGDWNTEMVLKYQRQQNC